MSFAKPEANPSFPQLEHGIAEFWKREAIFRKSVRDQGQGDYVFYDGPPFATGTPHYGHLLAGTLKDIVPRYWTMRGYRVDRRFGWDTHGLPVEMEIEKDLGIKSPSEVQAYGVGRYNEACRAIVLRYVDLWRQTVERMGRWVDFDNDYKTMNPEFMESVWWVFSELWNKGLIYRGYKVMPYSWRLGTPLSNFEAGMDYRRVQDPAVTVRFAVKELENTSILAWTTTPWTLPSNLGLCVGADIDYVVATRPGQLEKLIVAQALAEKVLGEHQVVEVRKGATLVGLHYTPPFSCYAGAAQDGAFRVVSDGYVSTEDGTGVVHTAPAFGEDDHRIGLHWGLGLVDPVDAEGRFTGDIAAIADGSLVGIGVKDADKALVRDLKERGLLFAQATVDHDYPFCWRSGTPLIYKAMPTWFVRVESVAPGSQARPLRERMHELNEGTRWVPEYVGQKRFANWIHDARDWAISRNRFWGTPLPVWQCTGCGHFQCIGAVSELEKHCRREVHDLHKHHVDDLAWTCTVCGQGEMHRVPEVLDCWFESGSMPYAQNHYPFENKELVEKNLPARFIAEGLDQTRGWFYTLLVLSTALFDRPAFDNVIVNGLILAEDGQKMSKRLKNYPDPTALIETYGADALRAYLVTSPAVRAEPMRFAEAGVREVVRAVVLPLWNAYSFFATYAAADGWEPPTTPSPLAERALLDRWLTSVLQSLLRDVNEEMEAYRLYNVIPRVVGFIDDLTNWYIRRSRRRFWKNEDARDHQHAFETLYEVLTTFARVLAPILPFMAELLHQRLVLGQPGALESVHLEAFPQAQPERVDAGLEARMKAWRTAVKLGRNLREQAKIGIRYPLARMTVALREGPKDPLHAAFDHEDAFDIIRDELNVHAFELLQTGAHGLVDIKAKLNFRNAAKRLGPKVKAVAAALEGWDTAYAAAVQGQIDAGQLPIVEGETLTRDDIDFRQSPRVGLCVATEEALTVALDTTVTPALHREGLSREVVARVQQARKDAALQVEDRIILEIWTDSAELRLAVDEHLADVQGETLATSLVWLEAADGLAALDAGTERLAVRVRKA